MLAAGLSIGKSLAEPDQVDQARAVIELMKQRGADVPIPVDVVCAKSFGADAEATVKAAEDVADDDMILDIGPQTAAQLAEILKQAGTIVWNGPVGVFEFEQFANGTEVVARAIAGSAGFSIAGGGDAGRHRQVRHRRAGGLHLHRRRRFPGVPGRQDPAGRGRAGSPRRLSPWLTRPARTPVRLAAGPAFFLRVGARDARRPPFRLSSWPLIWPRRRTAALV